MNKIFTYIFVFILSVILYFNFTYYFAIGAFFASIIFVGLLIHRINVYFIDREYAKEFENIYVMHFDQATGEEPVIPEHLEDFVVVTKYKEVCVEIEHQKSLLERSGNHFFCDENLTKEQRLKVKGIIQGDGEFINEDFAEYNIRAIEEIQEDRKLRHKMLKHYSPEWYDQFANFQNGVLWKG